MQALEICCIIFGSQDGSLDFFFVFQFRSSYSSVVPLSAFKGRKLRGWFTGMAKRATCSDGCSAVRIEGKGGLTAQNRTGHF